MGSIKYIITKIKCWPVFKQDPLQFDQYSHLVILKKKKKKSVFGQNFQNEFEI